MNSPTRVVAALYVAHSGSYSGLDDVDTWDKKRDARKYSGPHPVVAHPPCARWCRLAGLVKARWGYEPGVDGGCFAAALAAVRMWGGVLEHPAYSDAWVAHGLNPPPTKWAAWVNADFQGGWTCYVEQGPYGHPARKATWLYAHSTDLPVFAREREAHEANEAIVSWCGNHSNSFDKRRRVSKKEASATPPSFMNELLAMARGVRK